MKKKLMFFSVAFLLILGGCSEEVVKLDQPIDGKPTRTIKVKATVGDDEIGTRVAMVQDGFDVNLTWEINDVIKLVFTDGVNFVHSTTTVTEVSSNGRRAEFEVVIPEEITSTTFNLYGYYGGGSLSTVTGEEGIANLPSAPWGMPMPALEAEDLVMLRFAATNLDADSPELSVSFQHVGSLFKIFLENTSTTSLNNVSSVEIFTESATDVIYAHQNDGVTTVQYDVVSGEFVENTTTFLNSLPFITAGGSDDIATSEVLELWGWYPPSQEAGHAWPALKIRLTYAGGTLETSGATTAKTAPTAIGRAYHFYATYDGSELSLSNVYKQKLIDSRDMLQYNTIQIGNQTWMAENLKYYPQEYEIGDPAIGSAIEPHYYVYGYIGGAQEPEDLQQFTLGGILYNWAAALNGDAGSNTNPSGVQGICPDGWHLPSEAEWQELIDFVGTDPGNKLKDHRWWNSSLTSNYPNEFGFSARGGGVRQSVDPYYFNLLSSGHWLTSDIVDATTLRGVTISDTGSAASFVNAPKEFAGSVRCVKN